MSWEYKRHIPLESHINREIKNPEQGIHIRAGTAGLKYCHMTLVTTKPADWAIIQNAVLIMPDELDELILRLQEVQKGLKQA